MREPDGPPEVDYLTVEDLVAIALRAVGPTVVVADPGLLASAAARPQASAFGEDAYTSLRDKAAALLISIACNHALVDGNKRLGWAAAAVFCDVNGVALLPPHGDEAFDLVIAIAAGQRRDVVDVGKELYGWFTPHLDTER
jgi:death on curing protein